MLKYATTTAALACALLLSASPSATAQDAKKLTGTIKIDGSSTVGPITTAVAEEFRTIAPDVRITVGISGTGGGFKRFSTGEIDISNASRPIKKEEHDQAVKNGVEYIELPVAFDGLSIVVNPANYWCESLSVDDIKKIFLADSTVKTWKDIKADWPDRPIKFFAPGTDSGTFDYFKEVVAGKDGSIRADMSVSEDDNVLVNGVSGDEGALGFFGFAYFVENQSKLKVIKIDGGKGAIEPTHETIENGTYAPFGRPLFIYVNKASAAKPEVKAFIDFYMEHCSELVEEVGYVKLPKTILDKAAANFGKSRVGTQFLNDKGEKVSGSLAKVYN